MASTKICHCCEGVQSLTPVSLVNAPGQNALRYRSGTHARFKESMIAGIAAQKPLKDYTARTDDDPSIALIDSWAVVLDVLSFYQERIANEGYLGTAAERMSVLELARSIGYELRPGVAASTYLAFSMENVEGAPESAVIEKGTKAKTIPGQNEVPQSFETIEEITAYAAWQAMKIRKRETHPLVLGEDKVYLEGVANNLQPGDALLFLGSERQSGAGSERWDFRRVKTATLDKTNNLTVVTLDLGLGSVSPHTLPSSNPTVYALRQRAALFGYNAPDWLSIPEKMQDSYCTAHGDGAGTCKKWPGFTLAEIHGLNEDDESIDMVYLDAVYPKIVAGGWVALSRPGWIEVYEILEAKEDSCTNFGITAKTTRLKLSGEFLHRNFNKHIRDTVVFGQSEVLTVAEKPITTPLSGKSVLLEKPATGFYEDQFIAITGIDADTGETVSEVMTLNIADSFDATTRLTFTSNLEHTYLRESVTLNANIARATHGETQTEVLGSGDGSKWFQAFQLKKKPLTYVSAANANGAETTMHVTVDGVEWDEAPSLYRLPARKRAYISRLADDGTVSIIFGDGYQGARLPTGQENIAAEYRTGTGMDGLVDAGQISMLMTRPLGVKSVLNPLAPTGAANPEALDDARKNAPLTVLTLDRIVSLQDFEDFTRAFSGIGKAQATLIWNGERKTIYITISGEDGAGVPGNSDLYKNLLSAIDGARHAGDHVIVRSYQPKSFGLQAAALIDAHHDADLVLDAIHSALVERFDFAHRAFGQSVSASELIAVMQDVEGVVAIDLNSLHGKDALLHPTVPASIARWDNGTIHPAELLTIDANAIVLTEMTPS